MQKALVLAALLSATPALAGAIFQYDEHDVLFEQFYCPNLPEGALALWFVDEGTTLRTTTRTTAGEGLASAWKMVADAEGNTYQIVQGSSANPVVWSDEASTMELVDRDGTLVATFLDSTGAVVDVCEGGIAPRG